MLYEKIGSSTLVLVLTLLGSVAVAQTAPARVERGTLIYDGIPETPPGEAGRLLGWLESRSARLAGWLADGSLVIATRFGNTEQLHRVRAPLGMREQLVFQSEPVSRAAPNPHSPTQLLYQKDVGGNENMQLHLLDLETQVSRLLTDGRSLHGTPVWAHDGKRLAFHGNGRDGVSYDIYVADTTQQGPPRLVMAAEGRDEYTVEDWSVDDRELLVQRYSSITDSALLLVDVESGRRTPLVPGPKDKIPFAVTQGRFAPDARTVYYLSDHGGEHIGLWKTDVYTGERTALAPQERWDVEQFDVSSDGRYIAYTLNEAGFSRLVLHDVVQKADILLPALPPGTIVGDLAFDRAGKRLALEIESAQSPADIHVLTLGEAQPALVRWTQSELGPISRNALVPAELVEFPTWDTVGSRPRMLSAFLYKPRTPGPHPVVIDIHGGPESQYRPQWSGFTQYLVNELGYAVLAPNVRGSNGYGRSFLQLDNGELREDSVRDIGSLLVWIGLQRELDRGRVAVVGGSYGGYMVLASLVHYSDRLAGGVDVVGISDFVTFLTNTSPYRQDLRRVEYGDERDPKMRAYLKRISPMTNASQIRRPLLVVQGMNDPRVPASESEQMVQKLRANGVQVGYLAAKDEGHGFRKKGNRDAYLIEVAQFLKRLK